MVAHVHSRRSLFRRALGLAVAPKVAFVAPETGESPGNVEVGQRLCLECGMHHFGELIDGKIVVTEHHAKGCRYA